MSDVIHRDAASAVVLRGGEVLLIERGKGAAAGIWSLPGGHIEPGETAFRAALREIREETAIAAELEGYLACHEVELAADAGRPAVRYVLSVFFGIAPGDAVPLAGGDARNARFVPLADVGGYQLTEGAAALIAAAARIVRGCRP